MTAEEYEIAIEKALGVGDVPALRDALAMCKALERIDMVLVSDQKKKEERVLDTGNFELAHALNKRIRAEANALVRRGGGKEALSLYYDTHLFDAQHSFDSFCIYIEKDREPSKKFYMPRRKQLLPLVEALQDLEDGKLYLLGISMPPGTGKALANDTPVLTRSGWKNHGDLVVGDEVVGLNGEFKKVVAVHPKCELDVLVEFTNGEKIQCHENHEWMVHDRATGKTRTEETKYYEGRTLEYGNEPGKRGHRYVLQLPDRPKTIGEEKNLPIDPYMFGAWLGDGANKNPRICNAKSDSAIIEKIVENGYSIRWKTCHKITGVWYYDFDVRKELQEFGLCHSRRVSPKYIPDCYLTASVDQRLELLAGLIDTDGTKCGNKYRFTTNEESLLNSFIELLSTFGWHGGISEYGEQVSSSGIHARKSWYSVTFTPDLDIPCALERKRNWSENKPKQHRVAIKSITRVKPKQGNCITVEGDGMYLAGKTMLPTHNTTLAEFFLAWTSGKHPELASLVGSHSYPFVDGMYGEMLRIFDPLGEYRWGEVFPGVQVVGKSARMRMIDLGSMRGRGKRFMTIEFGTLGSALAGRVRATNLLYCDDLVDGIEAAMSRDRMDKLWQQYYTDLRQRKIGDRVKELHIATRWSVHDVLGRLEQEYEGDPFSRFIRVPALNEDGESNFAYPYGLGYSTEQLIQQRDIMDDASWKALFMNQPIEREGQLYDPEELRRYSTLPEEEPDAIIAVCDTKEQGGDYLTMPVAYQYGTDYYIDDFICDNGKVDMLIEKVANRLYEREVQICQIESNRGGTLFAEDVERKLRDIGGNTHITTRWTQTNKETRIEVSSAWVKSHCLFKYEKEYEKDKDYRTAMNFLCSYSMSGKNKYDDVPDALSMLTNFVTKRTTTKVRIIKRNF